MENKPRKMSGGFLMQATVLFLLVLAFVFNGFLGGPSKSDTSVQLNRFILPSRVLQERDKFVLSDKTKAKVALISVTPTPTPPSTPTPTPKPLKK